MKKIMLLAAVLSAASLCIACDDDSNDKKSSNSCDASLFKSSCADGTHLYKCVGGEVISEQCGVNQICENNLCKNVAPSTPTKEDDTKDDDKDQQQKTDECDETFVNKCDENGNVVKCVDKKLSASACPADKYCLKGECSDSCEMGSDFCEDENTVMICVQGRYYPGNCPDGCKNNKCFNPDDPDPKQDHPEAPACEIGMKPYCDEDGALVTCEYWLEEMLIKSRCVPGTSCKEGVCVVDSPDKCVIDACKDFKTLVKCDAGVANEVACGDGEVCLSDKCTKIGGVDFCQNSDECGDGRVCRDGLCYDAAQFDIPMGTPCDAGKFQEYCKDGNEVKCDPYDGFIVEEESCEGYNGCSMIVQVAYNPDKTVEPKLIRNAICRGSDTDLAFCKQHVGVVYNSCLEIEGVASMPGYSYSYSNACMYGTDGELVFSYNRTQTECSDTCDTATGLCKE